MHLKSLATWLFVQYFFHAAFKENMSGLLALCEGNPLVHYDVTKWDNFLCHCTFVQEIASDQWIPLTQRDSFMDLWCFFVVSLNKLLNKHSTDW